MTCKRLLRTTLCGCFGLIALAGGSSALADVVTSASNLSQANRLSLFHEYSIDAVGLVTGDVPGSAGGGVFAPVLGRWASTDTSGPDRNFEISFSPIAGYDNNPEARNNAKGGAFGGGDLAAAYTINFGPKDATVGSPGQIRITYDTTGAVYDGEVLNADVWQQTLAANLRRSFLNNSFVFNWLFEDQFTMLHGAAMLDSFDTAPSGEVFLLPQVSFEAGYKYSRLQYYIHTLPRNKPDSDRSTASAKLHLYPIPQKPGPRDESPDILTDILQQTLTRATVGYDYVWNKASGADYDYKGDRVYAGLEGLTIAGFPDITADVEYAHEWDQYKFPSDEGPFVIAGKPKGRKRKDHIDVFTLRGNARLFDLPHERGTVSAFVEWDLIADRATLLVRHYNEFIVVGGLSYKY